MADITIWEQIRCSVEHKTYRLVHDISAEISKDASLHELRCEEQVPWQLREVMNQRAQSWVQRLYDMCCETYLLNHKELSAEFDSAIWAYSIQPFIMREVRANADGYRASILLELLLCAVGSPPAKRRLLKLRQKEYCLHVRNIIYQTWFDKLHNLPPRTDEALAALAGSNAIERLAAHIGHGLPPDDPAPPPSALVNPLAQPEGSLSPRAFNSDPKPPASAIDAAIEVERKSHSQTQPLHIDPSLKKTLTITKALRPISPVGGHGTIHRPKPTEVLSELPVEYPRTLVARTFVIIGEAVRKFPVQTQILELCKYVISELTPHFREQLKNKVFRQDEALSRMHDLLHYLLVYNSDGERLRFEIRKEVLKSDEWLTLAREIAKEIGNDAPVKAGSIQQAHDSAVPSPTWEAIEISFLSDERVQIRNGTKFETRNYAEFGFEDRRTGNPNRAWETLRALAERRGLIREPTQAHQKWPRVEKRIQEIRKILRKHFDIASDPLPFVEGAGYQARFKIGCGPSYRT